MVPFMNSLFALVLIPDKMEGVYRKEKESKCDVQIAAHHFQLKKPNFTCHLKL